MQTRARVTLLALVAALVMPRPTSADPLDDARRILRITNAREKFELAVTRQAAEIVRTYASIVVMATDVELPPAVRQEIERCYRQTYAWDNFAEGIARLFVESLEAAELRLLVDFYSDRSVPPPQIGRFRELIAKADGIEQRAIEYMFTASGGCEEKNVQLILSYLGTGKPAPDPARD